MKNDISNTAARAVLALIVSSVPACVVQAEPVPGPAGPKGDPGPPGADAVVESATIAGLEVQLAQMQAQVESLQATIESVQKQLTSPDCPPTYVKSAEAPASFLPGSALCTRGADEVVRIGSGPGVFWIDRYEASIWTTSEGPATGSAKFASSDDTDPEIFPKNGDATGSFFALSVPGVVPSALVTWFQALSACTASGKRLPSGQEWLRAANGTVDPVANDGSQNARCNTLGTFARATGQAGGATRETSCVSNWGAEDMIGNLWEWTADWYAGLHGAADYGTPSVWPDPANGSYGGDGVWNVSSASAALGPGLGTSIGLPSAALRGGSWGSGGMAGILALALNDSPSMWRSSVGFRCAISR